MRRVVDDPADAAGRRAQRAAREARRSVFLGHSAAQLLGVDRVVSRAVVRRPVAPRPPRRGHPRHHPTGWACGSASSFRPTTGRHTLLTVPRGARTADDPAAGVRGPRRRRRIDGRHAGSGRVGGVVRFDAEIPEAGQSGTRHGAQPGHPGGGSARLVLFIGDDIIADERLLEAHLLAHADRPKVRRGARPHRLADRTSIAPR